MGSSESGCLHLQLTTQNIQAGEDVTGVVYLSLEKEVRAGGLSLRLKGVEKCQWREQRNETQPNGGSYSRTETYSGKSVIIKQILPVFVFQNSFVQAGHYSFPFSFSTPSHLPGSFSIAFGWASARIKYSLKAFLTTEAKIVRPKTELILRTMLSESITSLGGGVLARVKTCCCRSQGAVQVHVYVNKSAYVPGESAEIEVEVDNSLSKLDVKGIRVTLSRTIRLRSDWGFTKTDTSLLTEVTEDRMLPAGYSQSRFHFSLLVQDFSNNMQSVTSVRGHNVECRYTLGVKAVMAGCWMCCGESPGVEKTLTIYPIQVAQPLPPQPPIDWHPIEMPEVRFEPQMNFEYNPTAPLLQSNS